MPCGEHQVVQVYPDILKDVLDNTFFGMIECDIAVPEHLKECFAGMPPIFKNVEITCNDLSFDTGTCQTRLQKVRDTSPGYKLRGEMMKLMGKSSYGKCITDFLKHETAKIVTGDNYIKNIRRNNYIEHQDMNKGCEFRFKKMSFKQSLLIHIRFQVYQLAKLRVLQFYYDSIDYSIDKSDYQYCMMDTDSAYIAISDESLEVIKPSLKDEFKKDRHLWLERDDTIENKVYDSRTPGLFKLEYEGNCIISLASKMYYYDENKFSSKGINKEQNEITKQKYVDALKELKKNYKYYQLKKIKSSETFTVEQVERERPMTNIQRRNKRELDELERLEEPESKKRKNYSDYLQCVKNWDSYSTEQQEQLKKWYRDYYSQNKESERQRYRTYYALHSVTERERLNKYKKPKN
ncbi:hypothetical protein BATDEDRAFT_26887 [Batrachochytrium dendrobatidis JAM81]|uniref:DNA-directed DNA polymerase n=1 Tax=Batrachochytrium dendrobatidis (strain JAM81 / FGSC 10211) TaxID=684364 RepID=F4P9A3_BATDJ|nr:uncharacterized protein BATDEDRAFT_26887 [Batrachochytrium dendrobatidis JAM81]EGF78145.1 hypothetical protein BATDEDRAFT_26887 [Batrachochytrium dendrobatidis JAM81]|eukprot:XP_006681078.1 hypothetical protein BATDEDRAFT_26887 [Batrachochytrium dendrobatidis JAM81]